jgi:hypothetical protein
MNKLLGFVVIVVILALLYSVGSALWGSMDFDSKFSGYVQNAIRVSADELRVEITQLIAEHDIDVVEGSLLIVPMAKGYEVRLTYRVPLGIGGFVYVWEKDVVARTRFGGAVERTHPSAPVGELV